MIRIEIDDKAALRTIGSVVRQISFAASQALNDVAFEFRDTERRGLAERMTIRREFVLQGIQVPREGRATRDHLVAEVEVEHKRDFLAKLEEGGVKTPRGGGSLAIPKAARPTPQSLIPNSLRPLQLQIAKGTAQGIAFRRKGSKAFQKLGPFSLRGIRRKNQGLLRSFLIEDVGIFQRIGPGGGSSVRLLYSFTPRAQIPPDLRFYETALDVAHRSFSNHFQRRFLEALRTAR